MSKTVLDVGNCLPDHSAITALVENHFDARVLQAHGAEDTLESLRAKHVDLVLINRKLDRDHSDGLEIIKSIKADPFLSDIPVMMLTNFAQHQQVAVDAGAVRGFGKAELDEAETIERLRPFLS